MSAVALTISLAAGGAAGVLARGLFAPRSRLFGPVICRGDKTVASRIALTFDDGPWPGSTDVILDVLNRNDVKVAFFVIGQHARRWPGLVRRMHDEGHLIGNHSFDHHRLGLCRGQAYWRSQLMRTDEAIAQWVGAPPKLFRPPMGFKSPPIFAATRAMGHTMVAWSRRGGDGIASTPARIIGRFSCGVVPGDILLLHDGRDPASRRDVRATSIALPTVIENLRSQGFTFARLDEFIDNRTGT